MLDLPSPTLLELPFSCLPPPRMPAPRTMGHEPWIGTAKVGGSAHTDMRPLRCEPTPSHCFFTAHPVPASLLNHRLFPSSIHVHLGEDDVGERVRARALALVREGDAHGREEALDRRRSRRAAEVLTSFISLPQPMRHSGGSKHEGRSYGFFVFGSLPFHLTS